MLHIVVEVTFILIAVLPIIFAPLTMTMFETIKEVSNICCPALPLICAKATRFAILIVTCVGVSAFKYISAFSMLEAIEELSLIAVAVLPFVHAIAVHFAAMPLAYIVVASNTFPDTISLLCPLKPLPVIFLPIRPREYTLTMRTIVHKVAEIRRCIGEELVSATTSDIILPITLIDSAIVVDENTLSVALALLE